MTDKERTEKAIELLEEVLKPLLACEPQCKLNLNPNKLVQVLTLLKQPCEKCGGNPRGVPGKDGGWTTCPKCKGKQPAPSEFVRRARLVATHCPSKPRTTMEECIIKACDIITDRDKTIEEQAERYRQAIVTREDMLSVVKGQELLQAQNVDQAAQIKRVENKCKLQRAHLDNCAKNDEYLRGKLGEIRLLT